MGKGGWEKFTQMYGSEPANLVSYDAQDVTK